jgi:hypothetical protein
MTVHHWNTRHNVMADGPDLVLQLLRELPAYASPSAAPRTPGTAT